MADERKGVIAAGFSLLWRRQGVLWWVFIVSLILGGLGALPATINIGHALNHSLAGQQLTTRFDLGMYIELLRLPEVDITRYDPAVGVSVFLFFLFMLFATGGILETYRQDRRLNTGEFFAASGAFFWRFVRLLLLSIVPFVIVGLIYQGLSKLADHVGDRAIADQVGIFSSLGAVIIFMLLALWIRLWFDLAQVRAGSAERARHVAQSVELFADYLACRDLLEICRYRISSVGHARHRTRALGLCAFIFDAADFRGARADYLHATGDATVATGQRDDLV